MRLSLLLLSVGALSLSAFAEVSFEEKQSRVELIERIQSNVPAVSLEAYQRDLNYERQNLSLEERAQNEVNLLAEKIKTQVALTFQAELEKNDDPEAAAATVRAAIERDLALASPEMREELQTLAFEALESAQRGGLSEDVRLQNIERSMLSRVTERSAYLNHEAPDANIGNNAPGGIQLPRSNNDRDSERREYNSKQELINSLVSDRDNTRWIGTSNMSINTGVTRSAETNISYQLKFSFLGVALEGGPSINFKREYATNAQIIAEGLNPILLNDGNFDFWKRDNRNRIVVSGGKNQKRFLAFWCEASEKFETAYTGEGGFTVAGIGATVTGSNAYSNNVTLSSRRVFIPEYLEGRTVTMALLNRICMNDFLNARLSNNYTIKQSLNVMMRNVVSSLQFSHPKTKCGVDSQCMPWFRTNGAPVIGNGGYPRCVEEPREHYRACVIKGLQGTKCPIYKEGRLVSSGSFEYACDAGLRCVQTKEYGWFRSLNIFQLAEGVCRPVNPRTYRSPRR